MCTISIIPIGSAQEATGFRIVCNRDESRRRPPAAPPRWRAIGEGPTSAGRAIWPMDMEAGGTWIAASDSGIALCLMNLNPDPPVDLRGRGKLRSRGLVIPHLLNAGPLRAVAEELPRMNLRRYAPFRLIGVEAAAACRGPLVLEARWDRTRLDIAWHVGLPRCFVSSGLGDALVVPRLDLFQDLVASGVGPTPSRQDAFHRHTWPDRTELSVMMSRADARTVSIATLDVRPTASGPMVEMSYEPVPESVRVVSAACRRGMGFQPIGPVPDPAPGAHDNRTGTGALSTSKALITPLTR